MPQRKERERPEALRDEPYESKRGSEFHARRKAREEWIRSGKVGFPGGAEQSSCNDDRHGTKRSAPERDDNAASSKKNLKAEDGGPIRLGSTQKPFQADSATVAEVPWLSSGLRVRIIDEAGAFKSHYLKKCLVRKVLAESMSANVDVDGGPSLQAVPQKCLETVVSKGCAQVEVVRGPHRGDIVTLLERDPKRNIAIVSRQQDTDSKIELALDDVCEFKQ